MFYPASPALWPAALIIGGALATVAVATRHGSETVTVVHVDVPPTRRKRRKGKRRK